MGFVSLRFRIANSALNHRLIDSIGFRGFFRHQSHPNEQPFYRSEHRVPFYSFFLGGSSSSNNIFCWRMYCSCVLSWFSFAAPTTVAPCLLTASNTFASTSKATKWTDKLTCFSWAWRFSFGSTEPGDGPAVLMPSVITSTCLCGRRESRTACPAALSAFPNGVLPLGLENRFAQFSKPAASKGPNLIASRAPDASKMKSPASIFLGVVAFLLANVSTCLAMEIKARLAMTYFGEDFPALSGTNSRMLPEV